ncbi:MAG: tRNA pseudouridine(55) synthase TruB [Bacteroidetes bacterium]|nr:tRNA pseudouridine(55) synthase TruB [Bacteroidota bacterium]
MTGNIHLPTSFNFPAGEVLLIIKPYKWTSFDVIKNIRYLLKHHAQIKKIKVGHAGTLDPLASGLLIICTGKFTKKIESYQGLEKEYTGTFTMGETTPSFDKETEVDHTYSINHLTKKLLTKTTREFIGEIEQTPPVFSAIKIDGKRAYNYARNNQSVNIKSKIVHIKEFELTNIDLPIVSFRVVCSKGTYIRSLANDFGKKLECGSHLSSLVRTRIGEFNLANAMEIEEFKKMLIDLK